MEIQRLDPGLFLRLFKLSHAWNFLVFEYQETTVLDDVESVQSVAFEILFNLDRVDLPNAEILRIWFGWISWVTRCIQNFFGFDGPTDENKLQSL
jgi:hypothetical protein